MKEEENLTAGSEFEERVQLANFMLPLPEMETAPLYRKRTTTMPHRHVNLLSDLERNDSHAPHDLHTAKYTRNRIKAAHTTTVRCLKVPPRYERRLTTVFEVNEQFAKVPDAPDPEM